MNFTISEYWTLITSFGTDPYGLLAIAWWVSLASIPIYYVVGKVRSRG